MRLTIIENSSFRKGDKNFAQYKCICGNLKIIRKDSVLTGNTTSCGCYRKERMSKDTKTHGLSKTTNGISETQRRIYSIWEGLKSRCKNPNTPNFPNYGGRGISVHPFFEDFLNFYNWSLENGYGPDLSIDRIDVNGNYDPSNCRYANAFQQAQNTRKSTGWDKVNMIRNDYKNGESLKELHKKYGIGKETIRKIVLNITYKTT